MKQFAIAYTSFDEPWDGITIDFVFAESKLEALREFVLNDAYELHDYRKDGEDSKHIRELVKKVKETNDIYEIERSNLIEEYVRLVIEVKEVPIKN